LNTKPQFCEIFPEISAKTKGKKAKLKDKTQNSTKKLKLQEDFSTPERPSGVKTKKPAIDTHSPPRKTTIYYYFQYDKLVIELVHFSYKCSCNLRQSYFLHYKRAS